MTSQSIEGLNHHTLDQSLRAAQSIPLNIAESSTEYDTKIDYDNEYRWTEHEHEWQTEETRAPQFATVPLHAHPDHKMTRQLLKTRTPDGKYI